MADCPLTKETFGELLSRTDLSTAEEAPIDIFEKKLETGTFIGWSNEFGMAMKQVPVNTWLCTDTVVGFFAYYFHGELVAVSWQTARKNDTDIFWCSKSQAYAVQAYIRQLAAEKEPLELQMFSLDEMVPAHWIERRGTDLRKQQK